MLRYHIYRRATNPSQIMIGDMETKVASTMWKTSMEEAFHTFRKADINIDHSVFGTIENHILIAETDDLGNLNQSHPELFI